MSGFESSARMASLGTLLKVGGLAAVFFILLKQYKKMKAEKQIKIESPDSTGLEISARPAAGYRRIPISGREQAIEVSDENRSAVTSNISSITSSDIASEYNPSPGNIYSAKKHSAHALADVKGPESVQVRDDADVSPVSQGGSALQGDWDGESDELKEKLAAIDAIGCMAAEGNPTAMDLLFNHVQNDNFYVRYEAIRGILLYGGREDREMLHQSLPAGDWYIMDIRQEDMRKVC